MGNLWTSRMWRNRISRTTGRSQKIIRTCLMKKLTSPKLFTARKSNFRNKMCPTVFTRAKCSQRKTSSFGKHSDRPTATHSKTCSNKAVSMSSSQLRYHSALWTSCSLVTLIFRIWWSMTRWYMRLGSQVLIRTARILWILLIRLWTWKSWDGWRMRLIWTERTLSEWSLISSITRWSKHKIWKESRRWRRIRWSRNCMRLRGSLIRSQCWFRLRRGSVTWRGCMICSERRMRILRIKGSRTEILWLSWRGTEKKWRMRRNRSTVYQRRSTSAIKSSWISHCLSCRTHWTQWS